MIKLDEDSGRVVLVVNKSGILQVLDLDCCGKVNFFCFEINMLIFLRGMVQFYFILLMLKIVNFKLRDMFKQLFLEVMID